MDSRLPSVVMFHCLNTRVEEPKVYMTLAAAGLVQTMFAILGGQLLAASLYAFADPEKSTKKIDRGLHAQSTLCNTTGQEQ